MGRTQGIGLTLVCRRGSSRPHTVSVLFSSKLHSWYPPKSPGRQQQTSPGILENVSCHLFAQKKKLYLGCVNIKLSNWNKSSLGQEEVCVISKRSRYYEMASHGDSVNLWLLFFLFFFFIWCDFCPFGAEPKNIHEKGWKNNGLMVFCWMSVL